MEISFVFGVVSEFEGEIVVVGVGMTEGMVVVVVVGAAMVVAFRA